LIHEQNCFSKEISEKKIDPALLFLSHFRISVPPFPADTYHPKSRKLQKRDPVSGIGKARAE
jgi:hypothetical protein